MSRRHFLVFLVLLSGLGVAAAQTRRPHLPHKTKPDVIYLPTPTETVDKMLELARLKKGDVLYDLGSGDGRIPIAAAKISGVQAVGIEINPQLVAVAQAAAQQAGLAESVHFITGDLFRADLHAATVVTLYLSNSLNVRLRPKLLRELRPGTRLISHDFTMGEWSPEETVRVPWENGYRTVYVWTVPPAGPLRRRLLQSRR